MRQIALVGLLNLMLGLEDPFVGVTFATNLNFDRVKVRLSSNSSILASLDFGKCRFWHGAHHSRLN